MQVPEHVVSLYVATCGQNGPGLGSDEKEIILLVYVIIEAATGQIIGTKQLLVRPAGNLVKDRTVSTSSETSNSAASPTLNSSTSSILTTTTNEFNNSNTSIGSNNNNSSINNTNGPTNNNNNNSPTTSLTLLDNNNQIELPIAVAQAAGKPLNEAIEEFDDYLRSLSLVDVDFKLITDGQKPLRQCLHREACAKDIELPTYYNKFCDLRKEFLQFRAGDLSRALVPMKDIKKILQMPAQPQPQSIDEMMKDLNLTSTEDMDFYIRESRDMITVIQAMLKGGHKFTPNEVVNLVLEPGICSIDDEIDGNCIVRARGLPWQSSDQDIAKFFRGLNVAKGGVALCLSPLGRRNGEALVRFISQEHRDMALKRHKHHIGNRYIEVYPATGEDFLAIAGGASNEAQAFLSKGAQVIIRMRGLPYDCTAKQVLDFFTTGEKPCNVLDGVEGVLFVKKPDGRATGDAFVLFANEADAPKALSRHRESIGQRYIELFRSTTAEVQQVLNRSMDPKTYEPIQQAPLIAQLPTMQLSLLPQHLITSGTTKNCIRLRGLPYEALVEHILHFLDDFAKHIIYQGVHMVINAQGQPSGEAFIQMDSEESARVCAQRKHNQFMVFGKKYRYIEVFQCSGDDMNMVLNGGLQSPVNPHHAHLTSAGKQPPLLSPGMLAQPPPPTAHALSTHSHLHAHHPHAHSHSHTHVNQHHHHSLQSSNSVSAAVAAAALAQQPHQHVSLVGTPTQVPAVGSMAPYLHPAPTGTAHTQHPSLAAAQNNAAAAAAAAVAAQSAVALPQSHLQMSPATAAGVSNPHSALSLPFNITLPPPQQQSTNNALLAQQQAQFIAQHNLLARQQAAAVAVEQQQQQFYANLMMQHHAAAAAAAQAGPTAVAMSNPHSAGGQPQFVLMPRPYFQPFPISYMPQSYQFAGSPGAAAAAAAACSAASGLPTGAAGMHSPALPHSMKRSYEHAFQQQQDANVASAAKRALTRPGPGPGASVIGSPFGHFATFGPPTPLIASPHRTHHAHPHHAHHHAHHPHHAHAHPAAFYPAPLVYWPYPSPPVSPTTYYSQPTHSPAHVAAQHQPMYPVDYITATAPTNYVAQAPPMSPPSITIQAPGNSAGIMLTPNKTQVLPMVSNKHYPPLPAPITTPTLPIATTASVVYQSNNHMAHIAPTTYSATTPMNVNNVYTTHQPHNNHSVAAVTPSVATPSTQALLTIDTSTQVSDRLPQSFKAVPQCAAAAATPCAANNLVGVVTAAATPVAAASVNGQPHMSNQCVELYIS